VITHLRKSSRTPSQLNRMAHASLLGMNASWERFLTDLPLRMTTGILHVVSNVGHYADPSQPTGLWLSELTHAYDIFAAKGVRAAPRESEGRRVPVGATRPQLAAR
jgi:hypothetical protein